MLLRTAGIVNPIVASGHSSTRAEPFHADQVPLVRGSGTPELSASLRSGLCASEQTMQEAYPNIVLFRSAVIVP
jgi:hypothetical protein